MILTLMIIIPFIGSVALFLLNKFVEENKYTLIKALALLTTLIEFGLSLLLFWRFDKINSSSMQFVEQVEWSGVLGASYALGLDGLSLSMIMLTTLLFPICILCSWDTIKHHICLYMKCFLILESIVIGTFAARDLLLFFIFFESSLIPMFLIIGIWGGEDRFYASFKFFLYTLFGSIFMLISVIYIYITFGSGNMADLPTLLSQLPLETQNLLWLAFFASFAVKIPMWPVHTWLPDAHVQAPTGGSVILAGVLLKLGGYGMIRILLSGLYASSIHYSEIVLMLSSIAVIYGSLVALMQKDIKKMIAYSSVAHMGFVTAGIFSLTKQGLDGAIFQMFSHGLISGALFLYVGFLYERTHTKEIAYYGGFVGRMPICATFFMLFTLGSVGLPGTSGFVGEFMTILGTFSASYIYGAMIASGMVLGAAYMLWLYMRVMFGKLKIRESESAKIHDLTTSEFAMSFVLSAAIIALGICPNMLLSYISNYTDVVVFRFVETLINFG